MDVFLSWSGHASRHVASVLREWLPSFVHSVKPWMSQEDLRVGAKWAEELSSKLEATEALIICMTPESMESAWVHFEAGAAARTQERIFICPFLFGLSPHDVVGPLSHFQSCSATKEGTHRLLQELNRHANDNAVDPTVIEKSFAKFWPDFSAALSAVTPGKAPVRSERDVLNEILDLTRSLAQAAPNDPAIRKLVKWVNGDRSLDPADGSLALLRYLPDDAVDDFLGRLIRSRRADSKLPSDD